MQIFIMFLILLFTVTGCKDKNEPSLDATFDDVTINVGDTYQIESEINNLEGKVTFKTEADNITVSEIGLVKALSVGESVVHLSLGEYSSSIIIKVVEEEIVYEFTSVEDFYNNYEEARTYEEACFRTANFLMSGDLNVPDEAPTLASYQPKENDFFIRNTSYYYNDDYNTYYIVDGYGNVVDHVFKGGAYITLEEVCAYLLAFGDVPVNYVSGKSLKPTYSAWKEYLRLNNTYFSCDTEKYPYEPLLPGTGQIYDYYEIDLGTTGTTCDPYYQAKLYNNGTSITRGAARIVYTRYDEDGNNIVDPDERYVFYTYNHYNDFQEYLNYEGGFGQMFGNITGGGELSSDENYNPTPYVEVIRRAFL